MLVRHGSRHRRHGRRLRISGHAAAVRWSVCILRRASRQERERIDVALLVVGMTDPEVHVGLGPGRLAARPDRRHGHSLRDRIPLADTKGPEMLQGDRVAVGCPDGQRLAASGHGARERDDARRRRRNLRGEISRDVDSAVLPGGVGIVPELEWAQHSPLGRP
jgi:hypothetical protein